MNVHTGADDQPQPERHEHEQSSMQESGAPAPHSETLPQESVPAQERGAGEPAPPYETPAEQHETLTPVPAPAPGIGTPRPTTPANAPPTKRASGLFAGIAIGAIIGAIAGGASAAVVLENHTNGSTATPSSSQITIANPESSTQVSAIAQVATASTVTIDVTSNVGSGTGSGVIYSSDGYIMTNAHVVTMEGASFANTSVRVMLSDGRILNGQIVGSDPYADIAVVKVDAEGLTPVQVSDTDIVVGDLTVAIGAPFNLSNTVTSGVVSTLNRGIAVGSPLVPNDPDSEGAPDRENPFEFRFDAPGDKPQTTGGQVTLPVIQTDASINPGNSGGPLLNAAGELIGINVAIASAGQQENEAGSVGLGFAIPSTLATRVADSIIDGEQPTHGLLGATVLDARASQTAMHRGGLVRDVMPGSAAAEAGIQPGDIITAVDDVLTGDGTSVSAMIRYFEGGADVTITINRDGETLTKDITLGTMDL